MDEVEEVKQKVDIVDLTSTYLTLKKAGANYRALCPFHNEKSPSMMISPEKQIFKCFGCNEGGDIFEFVMKMENLTFREALEMLAQRAGVKLKPRKGREGEQEANKENKKSKLFKINALSSQVFHKVLIAHPTAKIARDYLKKRKLTEHTQKEFLIGYAPSSRALKAFLLKHGFSEKEIYDAGSPDRFYKRIIFPITDVMGNVLGFTGRVLDSNIQPKYLNTPETIIFHKGRILYNLTRARGEIKLQKNTVVVEGQMDVISSYQAGVKNVVATSGTALTEEHLQILYRYTPNITFAFDSDNAGLATAKKAYEMAIAQGFNVKMVQLGEFKDPGEMIEKESALWQEAVSSAKPVIDWFFEIAFQKKGETLTPQDKKEIAKEIIPVIRKIPDTIERAHYVELLAKKLQIPDKVIFQLVDNEKVEKAEVKLEKTTIAKLSNEQILLGLIIEWPEILKKQKLGQLFSEKSVIEIYKQVENWYNNDINNLELMPYLKKALEKDELKKLELLLLDVEREFPLENEQVITDLINRIKETRKENLKSDYAQKISEAEASGDREKLKALIKEFQNAIG